MAGPEDIRHERLAQYKARNPKPTEPSPSSPTAVQEKVLGLTDIPSAQPQVIAPESSIHSIEASLIEPFRAASIDSAFSFAPSEKDKEAILATWKARVEKRNTLENKVIDERKKREEQEREDRFIAKSAEAKKNYRKRRTSRTLGLLEGEIVEE